MQTDIKIGQVYKSNWHNATATILNVKDGIIHYLRNEDKIRSQCAIGTFLTAYKLSS